MSTRIRRPVSDPTGSRASRSLPSPGKRTVTTPGRATPVWPGKRSRSQLVRPPRLPASSK